MPAPKLRLEYVEMPCFEQGSREVLESLKPIGQADDEIFGLHMSYFIDPENARYMATTEMMAGTTLEGTVHWSSPILLEDDVADKARLMLWRLMEDAILEFVMISWLPFAKTPLKPSGEVCAICLPGGVIIENGMRYPCCGADMSARDLQKMLKEFALVIMDDGLPAHQQISFLKDVGTYLKMVLADIAEDCPSLVAAIENLSVEKRARPYKSM
jgi:hypothetical protein